MNRFAWMAFALLVLSGTASAAEYSVNFGPLPLARGERIVGLQLDTHAASFSMVRAMPLGWRLAIDNEGNWNAQAKGHAIVGAAALEPAALNGMFRVVTSKELGPAKLSGTLIVMNDQAQERRVALAPPSIHLNAVPP